MVTPPHEVDDARTLGPYRLLRPLGDGSVFLGVRPDGPAAVLWPVTAQLAADPGLRAEVAAAQQVSAAFVAPVVAADLDAAVPWLATEHVAGPSLAEAVQEHGPLSVAAPGRPGLLDVATGLAAGLHDLHAAGLLHRNLNPSNVVLGADGPKLTGYGIWNAAGVTAADPGFLAPEQVLGEDVGMVSDVFALGAVLVLAASGHGPFGSGSGAAVMYRLVNSPPWLDGLDPGLRAVLAACLAKRPAGRPTAGDLLAELTALRTVAARFSPTVTAPAMVAAGAAPAVSASEVAPGPSSQSGLSGLVALGLADPDSGSGAAASGPVAAGPARWRGRALRPVWLAGGALAAVAAVIVVLTLALFPRPSGNTEPRAGAVAAVGSHSPAGNPEPVVSSGAVPASSPGSGRASARVAGVNPSTQQAPSASAFVSVAAARTSPSAPTSAPPSPRGSSSPQALPSHSPSPSHSASPTHSASPSVVPSASASASSSSASPNPSPSAAASSSAASPTASARAS